MPVDGGVFQSEQNGALQTKPHSRLRRKNFGWKGIELRLVMALSMLSMTTLFLFVVSSFTFTDLNQRLEELKESEIPALEQAARLNDMVRVIITTSSQIGDAESNIERKQAMEKIEQAILVMDGIVVEFPEYHAYFKDLIAQVNNSLSLLFQSEVESEHLNKELGYLLEGFYPLLQQASQSLDQLPEDSKDKIDYTQLKALLYYQLGLVEKLYNDASFNDLDYTGSRLEQVGESWWTLWVVGGLGDEFPELNRQLSVIYNLASRSSSLYALKNKALDHHYQEQYFLQNSREHLNQLTVQIETNTSKVNRNIDLSIVQAQQSLLFNQKWSLFLSIFSVLAAAAISWFYVRKNILERLLQLKDNMFAISTGHLDTEVAIRGEDEVTQMAKYLKVFQLTAKVVKKTNQKLEAEVEERTLAEAKLRVTQDELVQAGKLAALGQLSVGITHEINQPLTAVNSHIRSAQRWLEQDRPDKVQNNLEKIQGLLEKVAAITRHLRAFSRKSDGKVDNVLLDEVIRDAIGLFETRQTSVLIEYEKAEEQWVWANRIRLEQVLVNLISNALDAVENQPNPRVAIVVKGTEKGVQFSVKDNGLGIPSGDLSYLFDPFYTRKEVGKGLGLGLSIAYNIIQGFGGTIAVESLEHEGTEFIVTLQKGNH
ncbi:two-component sensor histidine kinase [Enterovibrio norvegicus]|uniref:sensor histidine kinase n=1 Tax=Enterovibrio norvegicus TaxID=188144 RepID=UPI00037CAA28|nr:ATP-binding protein [Enterovibrio norvegicus]OEE51086.1 two-component sensor histidine kinase [Enterovibrio norvegicus]PMI32699.1 two-component sensor histidine kinase [Enterovibrio norvegicus]PMN52870.1 two-component sensor histidine kinase [Enterovibrio norvegicus]